MRASLLAFAATLLAAGVAGADVPQRDCRRATADRRTTTEVCAWDDGYARPEHVRREKSYGLQTLLADATTAGVVGVALAVDYSTSSIWGKSLLVVGPLPFVDAPVVHFAHGNVGRGFLSLGIRAALVGGLPVLATWTATQSRGSFEALPIVVGVPLGFVASALIDALWLAHAPAAEPPPAPRASFAPSVTPLRGGAAVGVAGAF